MTIPTFNLHFRKFYVRAKKEGVFIPNAVIQHASRPWLERTPESKENTSGVTQQKDKHRLLIDLWLVQAHFEWVDGKWHAK